MAGERVSLKSSMLESASFNETMSILVIEFKNGSQYEYYAVPRAVFQEFIQSESCGRFYNEKIKERFPFKKTEIKRRPSTT